MNLFFYKIKKELLRPYYQLLNRLVEVKRTLNKFETIEVLGKTFNVTPHEFWREYRRDGWEPETYANFRRNITKDTTFLDIGAWVGICSIWASLIGCKKIFAVEANPQSYELLRKTINANVTLRDLVTLSNDCISDTDNKIVKFGRKLSSNSMISNEGQYEVSTTTLLNYVHRLGAIDNVFIKIDIEGAEELIVQDLKVLKNSIKELKIFLALHPPFWKDKSLTCSNLLEACDSYEVTLPSGEKLSNTRLREMIMTNESHPEWGTPYGNLFEIMLSNSDKYQY